jgi:hypothetical protein
MVQRCKCDDTFIKIVLSSLLTVLLVATPVLSYDGDQLWDWNYGVKIDEAVSPGTLTDHQPVVDGLGGAYVVYRKAGSLTPTWMDYNAAVRVEHLDDDGQTDWNILASAQSGGKTWSPVACGDRYGNVIVAWVEGPIDPPISDPFIYMGSGYRVQVQKLNSAGSRLWASDAILSTKSGQDIFSLSLKICPDGIGGAYVGWGARLTHVDENGSPTHSLNGIEIVPGGTGGYQFVYDEAASFIWDPINFKFIPILGGVYAVWKDTNDKLFGQLVHAGKQWGPSGLEIADFHAMGNFDLAVDNDGDLLVCYGGQPTVSTAFQIRAQKLDELGSKLWIADGRLVLNSTDVGGIWSSAGVGLAIAPDDIGGAIVSWQDYRPQTIGTTDLYAQRLDPSGIKMWTNEILLPPYTVGDTAPGDQGLPIMVPDGADGAVVVYQDKGGFSWDIAATRVSEEGARLWSQWVRWDGTSFSDPGLNQTSPTIALDQWGSPSGVFVAWQETEGGHHRIFAEKVEASSAAPINDDCSAATVLYPGTTHVDSLVWAVNDGSAGCGGSASIADVWYKVTPQGSGVLNLNTCGSNDIGGLDNGIDTVLSVHSGCPGTTGNQIVCNDDWVSNGMPSGACNGIDLGSSTRDSAVSLPVQKNQTYYVRVSHYSSTKLGQFRLNSELLVQTSLEGDFNYDGDVDGVDLNDFSEAYPGSLEADLTGDGLVDEMDVELFAGQYGQIVEN